MPVMKLDAVTVTSGDLATTAKFYECLGFRFPPLDADEAHLEAITPAGEVRLMIDSRDLMASITGEPPIPANHSTFALKCERPSDVDAVVAKVQAASFVVVKAPWDAFWGQRYAIVADPDGYRIDLFAPLV